MAYIVEYLNGQQEVIKNNSSLAKIDYSTVKHVGTIEKLPPYLQKGFIPEFDINLSIPLYIIKRQVAKGELSEYSRKNMIKSCKEEIEYIMSKIATFYGERSSIKDVEITDTDFGKMITRLKALEYRVKVLTGYDNVHKSKNNTVIKTLTEVHKKDDSKKVNISNQNADFSWV